MKLIIIVYRDPNNNLSEERLDASKFKIHTDPGWLKIIGENGPIRLLPSDKVCLVQYAEEKSEPRIVRPTDVMQSPAKFQPS